MNFKRVNNITGWIVCIIACSVYILTMEKSGSLWDCGEFVSSCYKLQIPHPPGAPLFVLIGRIFTVPFDPAHAASGVNLMSALASGFTILFLFWTITHFARKLVAPVGTEISNEKLFGIMAAGAIGALAYTFSDSFWYSAVEGEVYALSSFFTAIVFWAMLKWEHAVTEEQAAGVKGNFTGGDRWIILIFYLMGLSIGVHLLNLLTIPAFVMIYYFKRYKVTMGGSVLAFIIGCAITGFVQKAAIQWSIKAAGNWDVTFVNNFKLPLFSGFAAYFIFLGVAIWLTMRINKFAAKSKDDGMKRMLRIAWLIFFIGFIMWPAVEDSVGIGVLVCLLAGAAGFIIGYFFKPNWIGGLKLAMWSFAFMLLGYSTYFTTLIRSNANPAVDMYNVDNPVNLAGYLSREQYGDWPILYGQDFTAGSTADDRYQPEREEKSYYIKTDKGYEKKGKRVDYIYHSSDLHLFPRMWDASNDQRHATYYADWAGIEELTDNNGAFYDRAPTLGENIGFFISYQVNWMYLRYFMWNFAGKQNDVQGVNMNNVRDGNWKTGIGFFDALRLGDQSSLPDSMKNNKANNKLFALPFILGVIGFVFQYKRNKRDWLITGLLFFFTGFAIIVYLNQAGNQPRERDYAFVGSFYAFAIWIGLGFLFVREWFSKVVKNAMTAGAIAAAICTLAVPVIMASQEWDDHDRSNKLTAPDLARDYLESCAENAVLVTFGDNDTYPLWYAQEVEGIRTDIRVINSSLLGTDWYINQLRYMVNKSAPVDLVWTPEQIEGTNRDAVYSPEMFYGATNAPLLEKFRREAGVPAGPMDLYTMLKDFAGSDDPKKMIMGSDQTPYNIFPVRDYYLPVDINAVRANGTVNKDDSVVSQVNFKISKNYFFKNDAAILNMIAANARNGWKRPMCFTSPPQGLGLENYLRLDGMVYRLVPVASGANMVNEPWVEDVMNNKFRFGNADKPGVYFDEENRRHLNSIRDAYTNAALSLAQNNKKAQARTLLKKCDDMMSQENMPYGMVSRQQQHNQTSFMMLRAAFMADDSLLANKIKQSLSKDLEQQLNYYARLGDMNRTEMENILNTYGQMAQMAKTRQQQVAADDFLRSNLVGKQHGLGDEMARALNYNNGVKQLQEQYSKPIPANPNAELTPTPADTGKKPGADTGKKKTN